jgi:hypothetical protein
MLRRFNLALPFLFPLLIAATAVRPPAPSRPQEKPPRGLSAAHAESPGPSNCQACHGPENKVEPRLCLACHAEIARELSPSAVKGFHREKGGECAVCHAEHQGSGTSIVPLDVKDFDHAETGTTLRGAHAGIKDCALCHKPALSLPRTRTTSYILVDPRCASCHRSPHPGREDECLACHNQSSWTVDRGPVDSPRGK